MFKNLRNARNFVFTCSTYLQRAKKKETKLYPSVSVHNPDLIDASFYTENP